MTFRPQDVDGTLGPDRFAVGVTTGPCNPSDYDAEVENSGAVQLVRTTGVVVNAATFAGLKRGMDCTLNGIPYRVLGTQLIQDGAYLQVALEKVAQ